MQATNRSHTNHENANVRSIRQEARQRKDMKCNLAAVKHMTAQVNRLLL
jgi:hypothetical protein